MNHHIDELGGLTAVARMTGVRVPSVSEWRKRGIPAERCPAIERATLGRVTVEALRPDVAWSRLADAAWPHPQGRPVIDVAKPTTNHTQEAV